jgi:hypothetical protein
MAVKGIFRSCRTNGLKAQIGEWTEWNIDLQAFADQGVNLTNVNSITIGFGNRSNLEAGGAGIMYFDDICLYPPAP